MKLFQNKTSLFATLILSAGLAACSAPGGDSEPSDDNGDGDGDTGDGDGDTTIPEDVPHAGLEVCDSSSSGPPTLRRLTSREFENTLNGVFPELTGKWSSSFSVDPISHYGFDNQNSKLVVSNQVAGNIDASAASVKAAVEADLATLLPCSASSADRACAGEFLAKYGRRLFRRPVSADEEAVYLGFFDEALSKSDFTQAIGWLTRALINSPATVYRSEVGVVDGDVRRLTQHEVATELAYLFTGNPPSDELLALADSGALVGDELLSQAQTLLATAGGREQLHRFFEAVLGYGAVSSLDKTNIPEFVGLRDEMRDETRRFIEAVVIDGGGGLGDLLTNNSTYPSTELAAFYGLPAPASDGAAVQRTDGIGVLAQGSVLASKSGPDSSSPTKRGLLVFESLLCGPELEVPPDVPEISVPEVGIVTTRQRYEEVHAVGPCASCHENFDPIGFGFEHFDEAGRYRADEGGLEIDASGAIKEPEVAFDGQPGLANALASLERAHACVSGQVKAFAYGTEQSCLGEAKRPEFLSGSIGFSDYASSLASEPHFTTRTLK